MRVRRYRGRSLRSISVLDGTETGHYGTGLGSTVQREVIKELVGGEFLLKGVLNQVV